MTGILIPLYSYPQTSWGKITRAKLENSEVPFIVVINPDNGPGLKFDKNFGAAIDQFQSAGISVLGYVYTRYGARVLNDVMTDIRSYASMYHVNGIFFDEMANLHGYEEYFSSLSSTARSLGCPLTIGNPGTNPSPTYVGTVDNIVIFEGQGLPSLGSLKATTSIGDRRNYSFISYGVFPFDFAGSMLASGYVGYMYVTNSKASNAYDSLPEYFELLVSTIAKTNLATPAPLTSFFNLLEKIFS